MGDSPKKSNDQTKDVGPPDSPRPNEKLQAESLALRKAGARGQPQSRGTAQGHLPPLSIETPKEYRTGNVAAVERAKRVSAEKAAPAVEGKTIQRDFTPPKRTP